MGARRPHARWPRCCGAAAVPSQWKDTSLLVPGAYRAEVDRSIAGLEPPPVSVERGAAPGGTSIRSARSRGGGGTAIAGCRTARPRRPAHGRGCRRRPIATRPSAAECSRSWAGSLPSRSATGRELGHRARSRRELAVRAVRRTGRLVGGHVRHVRDRGAPEPDRAARSRSHTAARARLGSRSTDRVRRAVVCTVVALVCIVIFGLDSFRKTTNAPTNGIQPSVGAAIVLVLIVCVGAPFFEELFFRGVVQGALTCRWGARVAIVAQAFAFALVHYRIGMTLASRSRPGGRSRWPGSSSACSAGATNDLVRGWSRTVCSTRSRSRCSWRRGSSVWETPRG